MCQSTVYVRPASQKNFPGERGCCCRHINPPSPSQTSAIFVQHSPSKNNTSKYALYVSYTLDVRSWLLLILIPPHRPWLPQKGHKFPRLRGPSTAGTSITLLYSVYSPWLLGLGCWVLSVTDLEAVLLALLGHVGVDDEVEQGSSRRGLGPLLLEE